MRGAWQFSRAGAEVGWTRNACSQSSDQEHKQRWSCGVFGHLMRERCQCTHRECEIACAYDQRSIREVCRRRSRSFRAQTHAPAMPLVSLLLYALLTSFLSRGASINHEQTEPIELQQLWRLSRPGTAALASRCCESVYSMHKVHSSAHLHVWA